MTCAILNGALAVAAAGQLTAAEKRAQEAERERDENLLKSGDITCMETELPGCGMCTMCLGAALEMAKQRAQEAEAAGAAMRAAEATIANAWKALDKELNAEREAHAATRAELGRARRGRSPSGFCIALP